jgi:hypothetical protein
MLPHVQDKTETRPYHDLVIHCTGFLAKVRAGRASPFEKGRVDVAILTRFEPVFGVAPWRSRLTNSRIEQTVSTGPTESTKGIQRFRWMPFAAGEFRTSIPGVGWDDSWN